MPSPFPGMNPYLESADVWHDFHQSFIFLFKEILAPQVRPQYIVKIEEQLYVHDPHKEQRKLLGESDVSVTANRPPAPAATAVATLSAPVEVGLPVSEVERSSFLEIRDRFHRQLITVIELLSPSNKRSGADRDQYLVKRQQLLTGGVNLVEIDLLRGGPRMPVLDMPPCDYYALACRAERPSKAGLWPVRLRERLPVILVPLGASDPEAPVDLQALLHRAYDVGVYEEYIYQQAPTPALSAEDSAWARQFLPQNP